MQIIHSQKRGLRSYIYPFFFACLFIYLQTKIFFLPGKGFIPLETESKLFLAFLWGVNFGLVGCPGCAFPLGFYISFREKKILRIFLSVLYFHAFRFFSLILIMIVLFFIGRMMFLAALGNIFILLTGLFMLILGLSLLGVIDGEKKNIPLLSGSKLPYALWGFLFGGFCGLEAWGFFSAINIDIFKRSGFLWDLGLLAIFIIGSYLPLIFFALFIFLGFNAVFNFQNVRVFLKKFSGFVLLLWGFIFAFQALTNLMG